MTVEINLTNDEKVKIMEWKRGLPMNLERKFAYCFIPSGKFDGEGYMKYNYTIKSNDNHEIIVAEGVTL